MSGQAKGWTRPADVAYPKIWLQENGVVIRDVTPDLDEYVVDHMLEYFARDEPLNRSSRLPEDPDSLDDLKRLWMEYMLPQRCSIVALQEGTPGANLEKVGIANPPTILGANMLNVNTKNVKEDLTVNGKAAQKIFDFVDEISELVDVYERYGVDHYMNAMGLSVAPIARGRGLGLLILKARLEVCRGLRIPLTKTVFTAIQSQKVAAKAGFQVLAEREYEQIKDQQGNVLFPNMAPTRTIQLSARTVP